ncbi:MAG: hypothetical protein EZS28_010844 [Streblomastix strix]|uniref:Uncharacterized protein n=1 Tax=Streblomastix strix TaxID=222440 RepID=A0A5J4WH61_9EUKA|nr:MAG: hypothetical protein EZS28_010844 [Streblomastix strix]
MAKEHMAKFYGIAENDFQKWLNDFIGFDIETEIDELVLKEKINVNTYNYSVENQTYYQSKVCKYNEDVNEAADESSDEAINEPVEVPELNARIDEVNSICGCHQQLAGCSTTLIHAFYISNKETLTGLKFCSICKQKAFDPKEHRIIEHYEKHIKKCEINEGKIVKEIKLEAVQRPFCPHIMQNKTYVYLLANNRENEFQPTQYYITYDFETVEKIINKEFGKSSKQLSQLVTLSVASTIKNKQDSIQDSEYVDVHVVGFNSTKFDFASIFKNLQSED